MGEEATEDQDISLSYPHRPLDIDMPIFSNFNYNCIYCCLFLYVFLTCQAFCFIDLMVLTMSCLKIKDFFLLNFNVCVYDLHVHMFVCSHVWVHLYIWTHEGSNVLLAFTVVIDLGSHNWTKRLFICSSYCPCGSREPPVYTWAWLGLQRSVTPQRFADAGKIERK